jgi:phasin
LDPKVALAPKAVHGIGNEAAAGALGGTYVRLFRFRALEDETMAQASNVKAKPAQPASETPFTPSFGTSKFDLPKVEVPAAFREFAEKGVSQAKDNWEKMKAVSEETTDLLEDSYTTAAKGALDYNRKVVEIARSNANAAFDFATELLAVKSISEVVELTTAHARKQFDAYSAQAKELTAVAQKVATEATEPLKAGVSSVFKKVA